MKVWLDGGLVEEAEARVPVTDHGFLYGDGIFEGMRVYHRKLFRLEDHLARLATAARALALEIPGGVDGARQAVLETARAFDQDEAYLRLIVSRGEGPLGVDPTTCPRSRLVCIADDVRIYSDEKMHAGISLITSSWRRPSADVLDPRVKSLNYLNNAMAKLEARQRGADEALLLNAAGHIAEASVANLFAVREGKLLTPPATDGALEGITRRSILELAAQEGLPAEERSLGRFDLFAASEVFLTGSGARIVPVGSLDGRPIGGSTRPVMDQLSLAFGRLTEEAGTPLGG
ncbi:MAG: branched-chain-amino-acid transaminase [Deltaproteobacteria bacterium]|nr:branched-chain-amino-acid transaminase [Deltaproteobacteria bacterium]MBW2393952.1 branched-chain-amino-acid transaminase [Deltaproteobacteria bacterium]